jgi:hypothetical protein
VIEVGDGRVEGKFGEEGAAERHASAYSVTRSA